MSREGLEWNIGELAGGDAIDRSGNETNVDEFCERAAYRRDIGAIVRTNLVDGCLDGRRRLSAAVPLGEQPFDL